MVNDKEDRIITMILVMLSMMMPMSMMMMMMMMSTMMKMMQITINCDDMVTVIQGDVFDELLLTQMFILVR